MIAKTQKPSDKVWLDEAGVQIPFNRLTANEKAREKCSGKLLAQATKANQVLNDTKEMFKDLCDQVYEASLKEFASDGKKRKGNFTWYNFDRSIQIEVNIQDRIDFDDLTIQACKDKLDEFLQKGMSGVDDFMRQLVMAAFEKTNGRLDAKKVMSLKRHKDRTKDPLYHEAMDLLDKAIRRPDSKRYFRISVKNAEGKYEAIELNFSNI